MACVTVYGVPDPKYFSAMASDAEGEALELLDQDNVKCVRREEHTRVCLSLGVWNLSNALDLALL